VEALCSRVIIINRGKLLADATPEHLRIEHGSLEQAFRVITTGTGDRHDSTATGPKAATPKS
jgi:ABC-type multidrug transport system ATPase subunit